LAGAVGLLIGAGALLFLGPYSDFDADPTKGKQTVGASAAANQDLDMIVGTR
jgi:hypothetical protein